MALKRANGTGSVYKMKHKPLRRPWRATVTVGYDDEGNARRKAIGSFETAKEALRALESYVIDPVKHTEKQATFRDVLQLYLDYKKRNGQKPSPTITTIKKEFANLMDVNINSITLEHLQAVFDESPHAHSTDVNKRMVLKFAYKKAIERDIIHKNYASFIQIKKKPKDKLHKVLTTQAMQRLWKNTDNQYARLALIYAYTGMRLSEFALMKWKDIHLDRQYMVGGVKTKAGKNRIIPIADCIYPFVKEIVEKSKGEQVLDIYKIHISTFRLRLKTYVEKIIKETYTVHDLRYTFSTMAANIKMDHHILKLILGHAQSDITNQVYIHKDPTQLIEAVNKLPYGEDMDILG